ncbi:MAG TPA: TlpA disulfide reductase family protein [Acidobacteriaceae bacterium]|nr:TlpA disulfide reductase family protein [Acidobacteriaceae bacterium]
MYGKRAVVILAAALLALPLAFAKENEGKIQDGIGKLRSLPDTQRPAATIELAKEVAALPPGNDKVRLADDLAHLVTEGDQGQEALQTVADTLRQALTETPLKAKNGKPPMPYMDVARLVRYEDVTESWTDPLFVQAQAVLVQQDAEIQNADFTLRDMHDRKVTLSALRGKIVLVNFWATWCPPCRLEMPNLDAIAAHFPDDVVVLSISEDQQPIQVSELLSRVKYHPVVLLDSDGKVARQFHVDGIPRTFVYDKTGKLVAEAIDQQTQRQFLAMLQKAGLQI